MEAIWEFLFSLKPIVRRDCRLTPPTTPPGKSRQTRSDAFRQSERIERTRNKHRKHTSKTRDIRQAGAERSCKGKAESNEHLCRRRARHSQAKGEAQYSHAAEKPLGTRVAGDGPPRAFTPAPPALP